MKAPSILRCFSNDRGVLSILTGRLVLNFLLNEQKAGEAF